MWTSRVKRRHFHRHSIRAFLAHFAKSHSFSKLTWSAKDSCDGMKRESYEHLSNSITHRYLNSLRIPISYFPKSRPSQPSVMEIPWPLSHYGKNPFEGNASVRSITLSEMRCLPKIQSTGSESIHVSAFDVPKLADTNILPLQLSIPSPSCFTSGEDIPFILSMKFPQAPTAPALLTPNIRIELIKRTRISRLGGVEVAIRETAVGTAEIRNIMEPAEGITHLSGVLQGGRAGRESSWHVHGMADVQVSTKL